ncbi:MAG: flavodoxin family protein [Endomicrobiales bacterium]
MADGKKILVVYYSRTGTTGRVAKDIAARLDADIEKITDLKKRSGAAGRLYAGRDAVRRSTTEIGPVEKNPADYDLTVIGTPIWAGNMTSAVRTYLGNTKTRVKNIACFST